MARICEFGEAALEEYIDWPIPTDHLLVEFICLPTAFTRFQVIVPGSKKTSIERCLPFNAPLVRGKKQGTIMDAFNTNTSTSTSTTSEKKSEHNNWDPDRVTEQYNSLKTKYSSVNARIVMEKCVRVANEFLE
jgi:hypothetical protein